MISNKGASPTLVMLIIIVFLFFFFYAYSITLANETNKQAVINLRQADVIRLENSFNLFNTSLGITWYISSIQTLFSATNPHSLGCGEDDAVYATDDFLLPGYWYRYDNESGPKNSGKAVTWIAGPGTKYNYVTIDYQPHICYPSDKNITDYLQEKFRGDFINNIPEIPSPKSPESLTSFAVGGVNYKIDKKTIYNNFTLDDNGVNSSTEQLISLATSSGSIGQKTINNFTIDTELPLIFRAARNFVDWIINYDVFSISYRDISYKINGNDAFDNKDSYLGRMKKNFDDISNGIKIDNNMQVTQVTTNYNTFELFAADHNGNIMKEGEGTVGLIFHYDVTENFNEGGTTSGSGTCTLPPNIAQYQTIINSAVTSKTWGFRSMTFTNEEMIAFIEGIMKQESNGDQFAVSSGCGAAGLMQFMPGTAKDYGMTKIYQDSSITTCDPVYSDSLSKLSNSQKLQQDDRFDPNKEIPAAVNFVYDLMDGLYPYTSDRNELLKFTAAAYNAGLGRVRTEIQRKLPTYPSYNDIASQLPQQTQTYVQIVFGNFQSYSQCTLASGGTYYNYDSTNQKFVKRPFTLNVRAEDYFSVLSCGNDMKSYAWSNKDDMACCGGSLWACGVDIPRLPGYRKLGESEKLTNARFIGDTAAGICTDLLTKARYPQQPVFTEDWGDKCFVVTLECNSSAFIVPPYEVSCDPAQQTNVCSRSTIYNSRTECLKTTGCFWKSGESHCIVCSSTNDCRTFDNSDACGVCPVTGKTCVQEYTGSDYNTWKCNAKTS